MGKWLNKLWYIYTMRCYSAMKKEWTMNTHNNLEGSLGNYAEWKKNPISKLTYCMILFIWYYWDGKIIEMENRLVIARG